MDFEASLTCRKRESEIAAKRDKK